jgi:hypothetical protein
MLMLIRAALIIDFMKLLPQGLQQQQLLLFLFGWFPYISQSHRNLIGLK